MNATAIGAPHAVHTRTLPLGVIGLLAVAMTLNYVDRGSLAIVAPVLGQDFKIASARMGLLLSAFFWTYSACQPIAGWLAQRLDVKIVMAGGVALWAGATVLSGAASSFAMLLALRLLLGIGESVIFPSNACLFARSIPAHQRGRVNGVMSVAINIGPSVGAILGGVILVAFGWRAVFLILGTATFLWLIPWLSLDSGASSLRANRMEASPSYGAILRCQAFWGVAVGQFCFVYPAYLLLTWLPLYLTRTAHLSLGATTLVLALTYAADAAVAVTTAIFSDMRIAAGHPASSLYKILLTFSLGVAAIAMALSGLSGGVVAIACFMLYALAHGLGHPFLFVVGQTLSGSSCGGKWMGLQNMVGNLAGILAPITTGFVVQATGSFEWAFMIAAIVAGVGIIFYALVTPPVVPIDWAEARQ